MRPTDAALIEAARRRGWPWPSNVLVFVSRRENRHAAQKYFREARGIDMEDLIKRIEAAEGPCRKLGAEIARATKHWSSGEPLLAPNYTSSIDAAMTLVPEGFILQLSEWDHEDLRAKGPWQAVLTQAGKRDSDLWGYRCDHAKTPALALCAAALRARLEKPLA